MVSRRIFLRKADAVALATAALPLVGSLPAVAAPPPLEQCAALRAELEAPGVVILQLPGNGAKVGISCIREDGLRFTCIPSEEWGTADGVRLLRQSVTHHRGTEEDWARGKADLMEQIDRLRQRRATLQHGGQSQA